MQKTTLFDHLSEQLSRLCGIAGMDPESPLLLLSDLLGVHASRPLSEPPAWPSGVADDHSPVEFSLAYNDATHNDRAYHDRAYRDRANHDPAYHDPAHLGAEPPALRILAEVVAPTPSVTANRDATYAFLELQRARFGLSTRWLEAIRDLFDTPEPTGAFTVWLSLVFRSGRQPEFKVYFNPELEGVERSPAIVAASLERLGMREAYPAMIEHAVRPGELASRDRLTFFAVDLHDGPQARVKLYLSHHDAEVRDVARASHLVDGVDPARIAGFCALAGDTDRFERHPLVGSYTFTDGADRPVGYSVYVPIRGYAADDAEARERVLMLLDFHQLDRALLDHAIGALTRRPLAEGSGLIAHVSLRLGPPRPGLTIYLSAEAYGAQAPAAQAPAAQAPAAQAPAALAVAAA